MIKELKITGFQSIRLAKIPLGKLTVLVGETGSGKSAFIRAVTAVIENIRGNREISHGSNKFIVTAETDNGSVTLERTMTTSTYKTKVDGQESKFTSLNAAVPAEVSEVLGILPSDSVLSMSGQHDPAFLLSSSGGEVARVIGSLTNVDVIQRAAKEANRLKSSASSQLKSTRQSLESLDLKIETLSHVEEKSRRLESLTADHLAVTDSISNLNKLRSLIGRVETDKAAVESLKVSGAPPDLGDIKALLGRIETLRGLMLSISNSNSKILEAEKSLAESVTILNDTEQELEHSLEELGICPLCNQEMQ